MLLSSMNQRLRTSLSLLIFFCFVTILQRLYIEKSDCPPKLPVCTFHPPCPPCPRCPQPTTTCTVCPPVMDCPEDQVTLDKYCHYDTKTFKPVFKSDELSIKNIMLDICPNITKSGNIRQKDVSKVKYVKDMDKKFEDWKSRIWVDNPSVEDMEEFCKPFKFTYLNLGMPLQKRLRMCVWAHKEEIVSQFIVRGEVWEPNVVDSLVEAVLGRENAIVIDVGGHVGQFTLIAAYLNTTVVTFEALPDHTEMISRSLFLNKLTKRVHLFNNGLYYTSKSVYIQPRDENKGGTFINEQKYNNSIPIDIITFDTIHPFLEELLAPNFRVNFLKADIEGSEPFFIMGAEDFFLNHEIDSISLEVSDFYFSHDVCDIDTYMKFFGMLGYNMRYMKYEQYPIFYDYQDEYSKNYFKEYVTKNLIVDLTFKKLI